MFKLRMVVCLGFLLSGGALAHDVVPPPLSEYVEGERIEVQAVVFGGTLHMQAVSRGYVRKKDLSLWTQYDAVVTWNGKFLYQGQILVKY
ncbi:MAG: hypothetical protein WAV09_00945 [Minisyncoccia bacterium]